MSPDLPFWNSEIGKSILRPLAAVDGSTVIAVVATLVMACIGFSVLRKGKQGGGWFAIGIFVGFVSFLGRVGGSLFQEISASCDTPSDWDSD